MHSVVQLFRSEPALTVLETITSPHNNKHCLVGMEKKMAIPRRLEGQRAILTASTQGIGYAMARRLAQEGATVFVSSRLSENVDSAVQALRSEGLDVFGMRCHVGRAEHREELVEFVTDGKTKNIDILISNAAVSPFVGDTLDISDSQYDKVFDINVRASFMLIKSFYPFINEGGSIILISSFVGYDPHPPLGIYSITKTALMAMTKVLSKDLYPAKKIRVNCIAPGVIKTNFSEVIWRDEESFDLTRQRIIMRRAGEDYEIAGTAAFLCSDDASYITGETIVVNGGLASRL